jgi:hypothetical protein
MSTINISDLEFVTRESLASDFKASGSALPPNTAIIDVRKTALHHIKLYSTQHEKRKLTSPSLGSRSETATTSAATSKAQPGSPHHNSTPKPPS